MKAHDIGLWGEEQALKYLKKKGYKFLQSRYRTRLGEIDLIVSKREMVVFVEVKLRSNGISAAPRDYVTPSKQRKIQSAALEWLAQRGEDIPIRFDVIELDMRDGKTCITHIENAF